MATHGIFVWEIQIPWTEEPGRLQSMWSLLACACILSHFSHIWLFVTLWTVVHQAPLPTGFSRQEYWSGLPCPPPGHLPDPGMEPRSLTLAGGFFTSRASWEAHMQTHTQNYNNIKYRNLEISINICKCILGGGLNGWVICNLWMFALLIFMLLFLWEWLDIACFICINSHATF